MNRGEIRWYTFRPPDKRRPVLILTRSDVIDRLSGSYRACLESCGRIADQPVDVVRALTLEGLVWAGPCGMYELWKIGSLETGLSYP